MTDDFDPKDDGLGVFRGLLAAGAVTLMLGLVFGALWLMVRIGDPPAEATVTRPEDAEVLVECPVGTYSFVDPEYLLSTILEDPPAELAETCLDEMAPWPVACWVCSSYDEEAEDQLYHRLCCLYSDGSTDTELP